jgi:phosphatidate cytidylyltransferase
MLLQRVITALVLLPIVLGAIWFAPPPWLYLLFSGAGLIAAWEWTGMMGVPQQGPGSGRRWLYLLLTALALAGAWAERAAWPWLAALSVAWWLFAATLIPGFPGNLQRSRPGVAALGALGLVLVVPTILSLAVLRAPPDNAPGPDGALRLLYSMALVWVADIGAYFAGRALGRNKLAPNVSPGKTREGAIGGLLLCGVYALTAGAWVFHLDSLQQRLALLGLSLAVAALSIVGDLGISMFKRLRGIKDSGKLLPGHGGVLDRIDSLLAAAPAMALGLLWLRL